MAVRGKSRERGGGLVKIGQDTRVVPIEGISKGY